MFTKRGKQGMKNENGFTIEFIKDCEFNGVSNQKLWKVEPAIKYYDVENIEHETHYVVTSAAMAMFSGPETYAFPADESGEVIAWSDLPGSFQGGFDHEKVIASLNHDQKWF